MKVKTFYAVEESAKQAQEDANSRSLMNYKPEVKDIHMEINGITVGIPVSDYIINTKTTNSECHMTFRNVRIISFLVLVHKIQITTFVKALLLILHRLILQLKKACATCASPCLRV